jgi:hypothetical protein
LLKGLGQVCRVQMMARVQNKIYDEMSVSWTRGKNKGGGEKPKNTKSVRQMTKKKRKKGIETRSVSLT